MQEKTCSKQSINTLQMLKEEAQATYCRPLKWETTVLLAHYDQQTTLLVTARGEIFQMPQTLVNTLNQFASHNDCFESDIMSAYQLVNCPYRGLVQGLHRLVPTCGLHSADLVFYNAAFLEDYCYLTDESQMQLNFRLGNQALHVKVPASHTGFAKRLAAADHVSALQLDHLHYLMHCYGFPHECTPISNVYVHFMQLRKRALDCFESRIKHCFDQTFQHCYGEKPDADFLSSLHQAVHRCFQHKF